MPSIFLYIKKLLSLQKISGVKHSNTLFKHKCLLFKMLKNVLVMCLYYLV